MTKGFGIGRGKEIVTMVGKNNKLQSYGYPDGSALGSSFPRIQIFLNIPFIHLFNLIAFPFENHGLAK
jgi:hypothetical protein